MEEETLVSVIRSAVGGGGVEGDFYQCYKVCCW